MKESTNNKQELNTERDFVNGSTNEQIAATMQEEWNHGIIPEGNINDADILRIQENIHQHIGYHAPSKSRYLLKWIQIAASILLPICILGMAYIYHENKQYASTPMMKVVTGEGEQVAVTLPDGTHVIINSSSELKYALQSFSQKEREVYFDGEGYYKVAKDKEHPFVIHSHSMDIRVLGTEFNVINRKNDPTAQVALINGCVQLTSLVTGNTYTMSPNEIAIINKKTGDMDIHQTENIQDATAWQQKQTIFRDEPIHQVIKSLEKNYNIDIKNSMSTNENFTGTLPTNNLEEAFKIISVSYNCSIQKISNNKYIIKGKK